MELSPFANHFLNLPRPAKRLIAMGFDVALCMLTLWMALSLRLERPVGFTGMHWWAFGVSVALALPLFVVYGFYRAIFRYSGWHAMRAVTSAIGVYGLFFAGIFTLWGVPEIPRSVGVSQPLMLLVTVGGSRALLRFWLGGHYNTMLKKGEVSGTLIYGAGSAGRQLAAGLRSAPEPMHLLGFLDDDEALQGHQINGWKVYAPAELPQLIQRLGIKNVLLALPSVNRTRRLEILEALRQVPIHVRTLPGLADMAAGRVQFNDLQELDLNDLLGRAPVEPDAHFLHLNTKDKVVLVTGAGGSIGSELCRQLVYCGPSKLLLVERSEFALYQIHQELQQLSVQRGSGVEIVPLLASVTSSHRMHEIMSTWEPHTVYHAAAYKHVPLVEHNPAEGVFNNVWGTWICAQAAIEAGVNHFVLVSTDKAVRPTNVMGASKRLAELVLQALAQQQANKDAALNRGGICLSMVRFGNVLGSSGSVVPLFMEQIRQGGPITLTHQDINRFFMTIPEAAQLVIQAGAMALGGDVFLLDMGQPVRIFDLAKRMVELHGLSLKDAEHPNGDIEVHITGLRPGEKLYEELLIGNEPQPTKHPRIMKASEPYWDWVELQPKLEALHLALNHNDVHRIKEMLSQLVQGYEPAKTVVDWVHLEKERHMEVG